MTRSTISEDDIPFALFALERMMFIRAFEKARWDLSAGGTAGDHRFDLSLRWPRGRAGGRRCRLVGSGQGHRDLPRPRMGSRGGPFAGLSSRRDLPFRRVYRTGMGALAFLEWAPGSLT